MGKKIKLSFLSKSSQATPSWPWPSCRNPKTLSFRSNGDMLKTVNAAYIDPKHCEGEISVYESLVSTKIDEREGNNACVIEPDSIRLEGDVEEVIKGLRSDDRLFYNPGKTRSIYEEARKCDSPFKNSVPMLMDSRDPYIDFKMSMEEMVEAHNLRDWQKLEKLLSWYLKVNEKNSHGYVIGAFVDLIVGIGFSSLSLGCLNYDHGESSSSNSVHNSLSSPIFSTSTSPCLSSLEIVENDVEKEVDSGCSQKL